VRRTQTPDETGFRTVARFVSLFVITIPFHPYYISCFVLLLQGTGRQTTVRDVQLSVDDLVGRRTGVRVNPNVPKAADGFDDVHQFWDEGGDAGVPLAVRPVLGSPPASKSKAPNSTPLSDHSAAQPRPSKQTPEVSQPRAAAYASDDGSPGGNGGDDSWEPPHEPDVSEQAVDSIEADTEPDDGDSPVSVPISRKQAKKSTVRAPQLVTPAAKPAASSDDEDQPTAGSEPSPSDESNDTAAKKKRHSTARRGKARFVTADDSEDDDDDDDDFNYEDTVRNRKRYEDGMTPGGAIFSPDYDLKRLRKSIGKPRRSAESGKSYCAVYSLHACVNDHIRFMPHALQKKIKALAAPIVGDGLLWNTGRASVSFTQRRAQSALKSLVSSPQTWKTIDARKYVNPCAFSEAMFLNNSSIYRCSLRVR
jgi:hypothetical protein